MRLVSLIDATIYFFSCISFADAARAVGVANLASLTVPLTGLLHDQRSTKDSA
jgi:hypothetical protein